MGISIEWAVVEGWLTTNTFPDYEKEEKAHVNTVKNTNLTKLENYERNPGNEFWDSFPKRDIPVKAETQINITNLATLVRKYSEKLSEAEQKRAWKVIDNLKNGAEAYQKTELPALATFNSQTTFENGEFLTDKIATWIIEKFVAGPFDYAPLPGFRCNPLIAIVRNGKIRPVVNISGPKGYSFNDNLDRKKLEKV